MFDFSSNVVDFAPLDAIGASNNLDELDYLAQQQEVDVETIKPKRGTRPSVGFVSYC
jgi:hypothetical protein